VGTFFKNRSVERPVEPPDPPPQAPTVPDAPTGPPIVDQPTVPGQSPPVAPGPPGNSGPIPPKLPPISQPAPASPPAVVAGLVESVISTGVLQVAGRQIRLDGVQGEGGPMVEGMRGWLGSTGNSISCQPKGTGYRCVTSQGQDIGQVVIFNGAGRAAANASAEYQEAQSRARAARKGVWARQ
jgi:hypothetical protein